MEQPIDNNLPELPPELFSQVMGRLSREGKLVLIKRRLVIFSALTVCLAIALVPAWQMLRAALSQSGFGQFLALLFYDFNAVVASWQNFLWSLLESMPVTNLIICLALVLAFLESVKLAAKNIKIIFAVRRLTNI